MRTTVDWAGEFFKEVQGISKTQIEATVGNNVWLDVFDFGCYVIHKKLADDLGKDEYAELLQKLEDSAFWILKTTILKSAFGEDAKADKEFEEVMRDSYKKRFSAYSEYEGQTWELLSVLLRKDFDKQPGIRFVDKAALANSKIGTGDFLFGIEALDDLSKDAEVQFIETATQLKDA